MNRNDIFPSQYLKAADLPDEGAQTFTIEKVEIEEIGKNKEKKPVIHFHETNKGLVCNKTNWNTICKVAGSEESDEWAGKSIALYRAEVEFQGEMVEAIRVKMKSLKPHKSVDINQASSSKELPDIPF
jgi:hypothetical protein